MELEPQEKLSLLEWLANEYKRFGCQLECVPAAPRRGMVLSAPAMQVCHKQVARRFTVLQGVRGDWRHSAVPGPSCAVEATALRRAALTTASQVDLREFDADSDGPDGGEFYSDSD